MPARASSNSIPTNPARRRSPASIVGKVGSNLTIVGMADLLGNGSTQMVMQQNNGNFWLYTYQPSTNSLSGTLVGAIGSNFHVVGFGPLGTSGQDEMLMQDAAGDFEVYQYNASENAFVGNSMGAVGAPWVVDGIAADPPGGAAPRQRIDRATRPGDGVDGRWRGGQHCDWSHGRGRAVATNPSHDAAPRLTLAERGRARRCGGSVAPLMISMWDGYLDE